MTAMLLTSGIDAKRKQIKDGSFAVTVGEEDFARAVQIIERSGLPKPQFATIVDVLNDDRLIASPGEERARLNFALSQELSRTVSEVDGVVSARVHIATKREDPLARRSGQSSASVAIHHRKDFNTAGFVPRIKMLIANAVDDLDYDRVSIALFPTTETGIGSDESGLDTAFQAPDIPFGLNAVASAVPKVEPPRKATLSALLDRGIDPGDACNPRRRSGCPAAGGARDRVWEPCALARSGAAPSPSRPVMAAEPRRQELGARIVSVRRRLAGIDALDEETVMSGVPEAIRAPLSAPRFRDRLAGRHIRKFGVSLCAGSEDDRIAPLIAGGPDGIAALAADAGVQILWREFLQVLRRADLDFLSEKLGPRSSRRRPPGTGGRSRDRLIGPGRRARSRASGRCGPR